LSVAKATLKIPLSRLKLAFYIFDVLHEFIECLGFCLGVCAIGNALSGTNACFFEFTRGVR